MDLDLARCFVAVDDHDRALAFYRDVLGLEVRDDVRSEGIRRVTLGPPGRPGAELVLGPPLADPHARPAERRAAARLLAEGLLPGVVLTTDDLDATFEHLRAAGAEVLQEPVGRPDGVRDCAVRDPAGNMLRFEQRHGR